jgi:hypothetical protein
MNIQFVRAFLFGFLMIAFLGFLLLFFAPLLMGITVSEQLAMTAISNYSTVALAAVSTLGNVMLCAVILLAVAGCFWGIYRYTHQQDAPQVAPSADPALTHQDRKYLISPINKDRHTPVLTRGQNQ